MKPMPKPWLKYKAITETRIIELVTNSEEIQDWILSDCISFGEIYEPSNAYIPPGTYLRSLIVSGEYDFDEVVQYIQDHQQGLNSEDSDD